MLAHIRLMRPYAWLWFDGLPSLVLYTLLLPGHRSLAHYLLGLLAGICADAGITTLNDICDIDTDRASSEPSRHQRPLVVGTISRRAALWQVVVFLCFGLGLSFYASWVFGTAVACAVVLGIGYSIRPVRLSGHPSTAQPFWILFGANFYLAVAALAGRLYTREALLWFFGTAMFMAVGENLAKDLRDWENDTLTGKRTSVVSLGPRRAALASLGGAAIGSALYLALAWLHPSLPRWARIGTTLLLSAWFARLAMLVWVVARSYDKQASARMHVGYIRTYLAFNALVAIGLNLHAVAGLVRS